MRSVLRQDLMDSRLIELLDGPHLYLLHKPESITTDTYVEYQILSSSNVLCSGDEVNIESYLIQIDVISKGDFEPLLNVIKQMMKEKNYLKMSGSENDSYFSDSQQYMCSIRFKYDKGVIESWQETN